MGRSINDYSVSPLVRALEMVDARGIRASIEAADRIKVQATEAVTKGTPGAEDGLEYWTCVRSELFGMDYDDA